MNLPKVTKELYIEYYKTLVIEIKDDIHRCEIFLVPE